MINCILFDFIYFILELYCNDLHKCIIIIGVHIMYRYNKTVLYLQIKIMTIIAVGDKEKAFIININSLRSGLLHAACS